MTAAGRWRQRRRPVLLAGLLLSTIWAAWWLWPPREPVVDFGFKIHTTAQMAFVDPVSDMPFEVPFYEGGRFHSADGALVKAHDVIRYEPKVADGPGPFYTAIFRMTPDADRGDFTRAIRDIWSVCDADVAVAAHDQEETFLILPEQYDRDCAKVVQADDRDTPRNIAERPH